MVVFTQDENNTVLKVSNVDSRLVKALVFDLSNTSITDIRDLCKYTSI